MLCVSTIDELKIALDAELKAKASEMSAIFEREFPGASIGEPDEPYPFWDGEDKFLSDYHEYLAKYLSLKLPTGAEALIVLEFGLAEEAKASCVCLRYIMLNYFLHSRIFSDDENPLYIGAIEDKPSDDTSSWHEGFAPPMAEAYERAVNDLTKLLSGLRVHFKLANIG